MVASPLPSQGPTTGRKCYLTPAFSSVRNKWKKIRSGYLTPTFWGAHKRAEMLRHLHSGGSPAPSAGSKIRSGCLTSAFPRAHNKTEMLPAFSSIRNKWKKIRSGYLTPTFWGAHKRAEMLRHLHSGGSPAPSAGSKIRSGCLTSAFPRAHNKTEMLPAFSSIRNKWKKIRSGYLTPTFWGAHKRAEMLRHLHSGGSPTPSAGSKIRSGCLTSAFPRAHNRTEMLRHPCILEGPQQREKNQKWLPHPYLLGGPQKGRNATAPSFWGIPNAKRREQNQKWLPHLCLPKGPQQDGNATSPLHSRASATKGKKSEVATSPLPSGGPTKGPKCYVTCILGDPQRQAQGAKSEVVASPLPSQGLTRGRKCYVTSALLGVPNKGEQSQEWLPHPCLLGGPKEGRNAMSPLHSRGSPTPSTGSETRSGYLTFAFSRALKSGKMLRHPCNLNKREQNQIWLPHLCVSGGQKEIVCHPYLLGVPQRQAQGAKSEVVPNKEEQYQKWLSHPYLLRGPKEGQNAMSPLHCRGSPTKREQNQK